MAKKCNGCGRFANAAEGAKCSTCVNFYHKACVNIPNHAQVVSTWICPECKAQTPRKDNTENPVRGERADHSPMQNSPAHALSSELLNEMKLMRQDMQSFRCEFSALRESLTAVRSAVDIFSGRIDDLEARLDSLECKYAVLNDKPVNDPNPDHSGGVAVETLRTTVEQLKSELNDRDQEAFCNDIEITGIPEEQGENVGRLISIIATKLGVTCDERDIVSVDRVGIRRAPSSGAAGADEQGAPAAARPRPLVLRVARRQLRDSLLQAARVRRDLTTDGLGLAAFSTRFYLNERLSKFNKMLFYKAREEARSRGWKYVWTRGGRIFVRRETGKASFRVRLEQDLENIFGRK